MYQCGFFLRAGWGGSYWECPDNVKPALGLLLIMFTGKASFDIVMMTPHYESLEPGNFLTSWRFVLKAYFEA